MLAEDQQVLHDALSWAEQGQKLWLVSVARTWGTAPRPVGSWAVIAADGRLSGSVSGGCIEDDLVARMRAGELDQPLPFLLKYGISADDWLPESACCAALIWRRGPWCAVRCCRVTRLD